MDIQSTRELICKLGRMLFARNLINISEGNISARAGKYFCMTPGHAGSDLLWALQPHQVLVIDQQGIKVDGVGEFPEDYRVHFQLYRSFSNGNAVIYCQPPDVMVFCSSGVSIPAVNENSRIFGEINFCDSSSAGLRELADCVVADMQKKKEALDAIASAVMLPRQGIFVLGRSLTCAFEAVERIESNARTLLMTSLLSNLNTSSSGSKKQSP